VTSSSSINVTESSTTSPQSLLQVQSTSSSSGASGSSPSRSLSSLISEFSDDFSNLSSLISNFLSSNASSGGNATTGGNTTTGGNATAGMSKIGLQWQFPSFNDTLLYDPVMTIKSSESSGVTGVRALLPSLLPFFFFNLLLLSQ